MISYRKLEARPKLETRGSDGAWSPFGVAFQKEDGRILLFVPSWRTQAQLTVSSLNRLTADHFPNAIAFEFRWSESIESWDSKYDQFHPICVLAQAHEPPNPSKSEQSMEPK